MSTLRKAMKQKQKAGARVAQIKTAPKKMDSGSSNQHEYDNDDTDET